MLEAPKELEDSLKAFTDAEAYFENAYLCYRLARRHLDEAESRIQRAREAVSNLAKDFDEIDRDSLND